MRIGVLGTGEVGRAIATKLCAIGHEVMMGSRDPAHPGATEWAARHRPLATVGTFADAAAYGALVVNATAGSASLDVLASVGAHPLAGKVLIDAANPLDFSDGSPRVRQPDGDSLGEAIQRAFPATRVVKALNTVNNAVMTDPAAVPGDHVLFVAGEDRHAKEVTIGLLEEMGWPPDRVVDLGGIVSARGMEAYLLLWIALAQAQGTSAINVAVRRA